jgi:MYXO-CTERM domain-containing protein
VVRADAYTVEAAAPLALTFTSGAASAELQADVYSGTHWEWNGDRMEGWAAGAPGVTVAAGMDVLDVGLSEPTTSLLVKSPPLSIDSADVLGLALRMSRMVPDAPAALSLTVGGVVRREIDVARDGSMHELRIDGATLALPAGTLTEIAVVAHDGSLDTGTMQLDYLRIEAVDPTEGVPGDNGCACRSASRRGTAGAWLAAIALALAFHRRRRS